MADVIIVIQEEVDSIVVVPQDNPNNVTVPGNSNTASLSDLNDVSATSPQEGQFLSFQSGLWRPTDIVDSSIQSSLDGGEFM